MTPEERIRNKVSGLKDAQNERNIRENFDATIGSDAGEAFKTQYGGVTVDPYTGSRNAMNSTKRFRIPLKYEPLAQKKPEKNFGLLSNEIF